MTDTLDQIAKFVEHGAPVFPVHGIRTTGGCTCRLDDECENAGKHPATANGVLDATTRYDQLEAVFTARPYYNVGVATGHAFDVLDLDDGDAAVQAVQQVIGRPLLAPGDVYARTGRGIHIYYCPTGHGNRARLLPGVDWRGLGGYVVAPPSRHRSGHAYAFGAASAGDGLYTWPNEAPLEIQELLTPRRPAVDLIDPTLWAKLDAAHNGSGWNPTGVLDRMLAAIEGERNHVLYWCANRLLDDESAGRCSRDQLDATLDELRVAGYTVGLTDTEIERTIGSAERAERNPNR